MMQSHSSVKYSRLPGSADDDDAVDPDCSSSSAKAMPAGGEEVPLGGESAGAFQFESVFTYPDDHASKEANFNARNDYGSAFRYRDSHVKISMDNYSNALAAGEEDMTRPVPPAYWLLTFSYMLTFFSYLFFVLTIPVSYWFIVKKMGEFDRMVVFRLGKLVGVKGPGRFLVFPWMDRVKRIDVRAAAFSVPPQQFITADGGIVEMGADIQYGIVDVVTMISEVADHQDILRSLGKTLLVKILVKKGVTQLQKDKRMSESEILDEINDQVRKWGINVHSVSLSETKVLKQPESGSNAAVGSILKGLGMKDDPKYPTPQEFVRSTHGFEPQETSSLLGTMAAGMMGTPGSTEVNMSLLQSLSGAGGTATGGAPGPSASQVQLGPGIVAPPTQTPPEEFPANWGRCLEVILNSDVYLAAEADARGLYRLEITETEAGRDVYYIELSSTKRAITANDNPCAGREPDVSVTVSSPDLASVLDGSLAPLQAYLTGRISATGDVRKLMFFDKLSRRGHKPGSMFTV